MVPEWNPQIFVHGGSGRGGVRNIGSLDELRYLTHVEIREKEGLGACIVIKRRSSDGREVWMGEASYKHLRQEEITDPRTQRLADRIDSALTAYAKERSVN